MTTRKLNPKQARFVEEYLCDLNATQAAIRAGYSAKTASSIGERLLRHVEVQKAIQERMKKRSEKVEITADRVILELSRVAFGNPRDVMSWGPDGVTLKSSTELTDDQAAQVAEVSESESQFGGSVRIKRHDKVKALELLGRHLGIFKDKLELGGPSGAPIPVTLLPANIKAINEAIENAC